MKAEADVAQAAALGNNAGAAVAAARQEIALAGSFTLRHIHDEAMRLRTFGDDDTTPTRSRSSIVQQHAVYFHSGEHTCTDVIIERWTGWQTNELKPLRRQCAGSFDRWLRERARREEGPPVEVVGFSATRLSMPCDDGTGADGQVIVFVYVTVADSCHVCPGRRSSHEVRS